MAPMGAHGPQGLGKAISNYPPRNCPPSLPRIPPYRPAHFCHDMILPGCFKAGARCSDRAACPRSCAPVSTIGNPTEKWRPFYMMGFAVLIAVFDRSCAPVSRIVNPHEKDRPFFMLCFAALIAIFDGPDGGSCPPRRRQGHFELPPSKLPTLASAPPSLSIGPLLS